MYNKIFKNLKVDIDTYNFIKDFENELKINDWEINNYLIDTSQISRYTCLGSC